MKPKSHFGAEKGSTLVVAICVLTVISLIAAGVLSNANARYNVGSKAVKAWKEALYAAEAGGDLAFNEIRKPYLAAPGTPFATGWALSDSSAPPPNPGSGTAPDYAIGYSNSGPVFGTNNNLTAKVTVDKLGSLPGNDTVSYYRIRSVGIAQMFGLKRTGMNDALQESSGSHFGTGTGARGNGDSLLRKIDYNYDHFLATYGYGDVLPSTAATSSNGKVSVAVSDPNHGQVMRRIEMVAVPVMPIEGAVKTNGGSYSFPYIDSYNSANGTYPGSNCAITPTCPTYADSRNGNIVDGSPNFNGTVYGDVTTNGGNADKNHVSGVIDNNVPVAAVPNITPSPNHPAYEAQNSGDITPPTRAVSSVSPFDNQQQTTFWYHYSSISGLTINPATALYPSAMPAPSPGVSGIVETTVNIVCDGDISGLTVNKGVKAKIYFSGNASGKANTYVNNNVKNNGANYNQIAEPVAGIYGESSRKFDDGVTTLLSTTLTSAKANFTAADRYNPVTGAGIPAGTYISSVSNATTVILSNAATATSPPGNVTVTVGSYVLSSNVSAADHMWFYGQGTTQDITLGSGAPATEYFVWYAPNANFTVNGNPDFVGAMVVKSFTGNGNNTMHFDKQLLNAGDPEDYRIASYVEDIR